MCATGYVATNDDVDQEIKCCYKGSSDRVLQRIKRLSDAKDQAIECHKRCRSKMKFDQLLMQSMKRSSATSNEYKI